MKLVCVDTHVLIWGIREHAEEDQRHMINQTKLFIASCKDSGTTIMVPSVVLGELLTGIEPDHYAMVVNLLESGFYLPSYDAKAAAQFAKIWREKKNSGLVSKLQNDMQATRQELKADCMIVATAITRNADVLYSHDEKLKKFASGTIATRNIPEMHSQGKLELDITA